MFQQYVNFDILPDGWFTKKQCENLFNICLQSDSKPILEVGSWIGRSTSILALAQLSREDKGMRASDIETVDIGFSSEDEWKEFFGNSIHEKDNKERYLPHITREGGSLASLRENLSNLGLSKFVNIHKGIFPNVNLNFSEYEIIFLDVTHDVKEIKQNVPAALELLKYDGFLCCDDIYKTDQIKTLLEITQHKNFFVSGGFYLSSNREIPCIRNEV